MRNDSQGRAFIGLKDKKKRPLREGDTVRREAGAHGWFVERVVYDAKHAAFALEPLYYLRADGSASPSRSKTRGFFPITSSIEIYDDAVPA